jgi:hypothetical protein
MFIYANTRGYLIIIFKSAYQNHLVINRIDYLNPFDYNYNFKQKNFEGLRKYLSFFFNLKSGNIEIC